MVDRTYYTDGSELTYQEKNHLMYRNGRLVVLNIRPGHPTNHTCPYQISKTSEDMKIKEWKKCMDSRKEVLGSNIVRKAIIGDR